MHFNLRSEKKGGEDDRRHETEMSIFNILAI